MKKCLLKMRKTERKKKIYKILFFPSISVYPAICLYNLTRFSFLFFADTRSWSLELQHTQRREGGGRRKEARSPWLTLHEANRCEVICSKSA